MWNERGRLTEVSKLCGDFGRYFPGFGRLVLYILKKFFTANFAISLLFTNTDMVSINVLTLILNNVGQCDVKSWPLMPIKTITSVLKVSTCMITNLTARPIRLAEILMIMPISTIKAAVILYICSSSSSSSTHSTTVRWLYWYNSYNLSCLFNT